VDRTQSQNLQIATFLLQEMMRRTEGLSEKRKTIQNETAGSPKRPVRIHRQLTSTIAGIQQ
jgi:hypothetical protein